MLIKNISNIVNNKIDCNTLQNFNYISTENMLENFGGIKDASNVPTGKCTAILKDDILLSNIRPYFKKLWFSKLDGGCSNDVIALRVNNKSALSKYVFYALSSNKFFDVYVANCKGTKMPRGNKDVLLNYDIPTKSLFEQQHIVDTIGSVDNLIEKYEENYSKICFYQQGIWDNFTKISNSEMTRLEDCILKANTGADAIQKAPIVNYQTNCRCVRVGDFTNSRNYNDWGYCEIKDIDYKRYKLKKDDILITRTASIGLTKFIFEDLNAVYNNGIIRITANNNKIKPIILYLICISNNFINYIKENESGSSTRPNMKIDYVMKYKFNLPTIEEQDKIESDLVEIETYKSYLLKKINKLKELKNLLLQKYFG